MKYTAAQMLTRARTKLLMNRQYSFFSTLTLKLKLVEDNSVKTARTDGTVIRYNAKFIESLTPDELQTLLAHEAGGHCGLSHHSRRGARDARKFNYAGDYIINLILKDAGFTPIEGWLYDDKFRNMSTEQVYNIIPDPPKDSDGDPGGCGEVMDAPKKDGETQSQANERTEREWKMNVAQAYEAAKMAGAVPAGIDRMVEDILQPKLDWKIILRRFVEESVQADYRWFPPNRRYIHQGLYLPSIKKDDALNGAIGVDVSGSIGIEELNNFATEMTSIFQEFKAELDVCYFDTRVYNEEHITSDDFPITFHPKGGGGTDPTCVLSKIEEKNERPAFLIIFTDMAFDDFGKEPDYPVLWVQAGEYENQPPYGELIQIS